MLTKTIDWNENLLESSSQHAAHVQLVACGVIMPSSINACKLRPPNRIDRFQSLLEPRPHKFSNSLGVNHWSLYFIHRPRPPEPRRDLYNSAVVVLHRTGSTSRFTVSFQLVVFIMADCVVCADCCSCCCCGDVCCWWFKIAALWLLAVVVVVAVVIPSDGVPCCCMRICVGLRSPTSLTTALPAMNPLLSTQSICLKFGNWSGVITLNAVPINEPTGSDTGTDTTVPLSVVVATNRVVARWLLCFKDMTILWLSALNRGQYCNEQEIFFVARKFILLLLQHDYSRPDAAINFKSSFLALNIVLSQWFSRLGLFPRLFRHFFFPHSLIVTENELFIAFTTEKLINSHFYLKSGDKMINNHNNWIVFPVTIARNLLVFA